MWNCIVNPYWITSLMMLWRGKHVTCPIHIWLIHYYITSRAWLTGKFTRNFECWWYQAKSTFADQWIWILFRKGRDCFLNTKRSHSAFFMIPVLWLWYLHSNALNNYNICRLPPGILQKWLMNSAAQVWSLDSVENKINIGNQGDWKLSP